MSLNARNPEPTKKLPILRHPAEKEMILAEISFGEPSMNQGGRSPTQTMQTQDVQNYEQTETIPR
jgi:hypothetical protein